MKKMGSAAPREVAGIDAWEVPGLIGAELAHHVTPALQVVQRLKAAGLMTHSEARAFTEAAEHLQRIALTSQQITRLAHGRLRQSHERLDVAEVVRHVLAENDARYQRQGIAIESHLHPIAVISDAGLLVSLCEIALECAACDGERLQVWLAMQHWPEHALLTIRSRPHFRDGREIEASHSLQWIHLCRLADATGVKVRRTSETEFVQITVEFPRTVKEMAGLTAMEVDGGADHVADSSSLAGHHVLLVTRDHATAWELDLVCRKMRLVLDVVQDCSQAVRFCELELPDMIVLDEASRDSAFEDLRQHVLRENINFPCLEIVEAANVVELGTWHDGATSRVSRSELRPQLQALLAMELAKVF
ncbi:hypothetical protein [Ramlibacter alkalitolerans]|jgi:hypothetical protein|uniref:Histidine kinase n=1 Tax=Ramlibacter alkalitolerans TaxID=2039631 RepID=A0ABS1JNN7_9BURK|nr:hypothetical protein [Ramlibacter alkalitolerans]MBL0425863.1 hypothetical protein [Ramlibacter alkalitolerans]